MLGMTSLSHGRARWVGLDAVRTWGAAMLAPLQRWMDAQSVRYRTNRDWEGEERSLAAVGMTALGI